MGDDGEGDSEGESPDGDVGENSDEGEGPGVGEGVDAEGAAGSGNPDGLDDPNDPSDPDDPDDPSDPGDPSDPSDPDDPDDPSDPSDPDDPGDQGKPTFKSIDPDIATVDDAGLVKGVSEGTTAIVYEDDSGRRATCRVLVESDELMNAKLLFAESHISLQVGSSMRVLPQVSGLLGAFSLKWLSSDEDVAKVDDLGTVTALKKGSSVIVVLDKASSSLACYTLDAVRVRLEKPDKVTIREKKLTTKGSSVVAMRVEWSPVDDAAAYRVYRRAGDGALELVGQTKKRVFVDKEAPENVVLQYRIEAVSGTELLDSKLSAAVKGIRLSKPPKLTGVAKKRSVKLRWKSNAAAKSYYIYRAPKGSNNFRFIKRVNGATTTSWKDTSVKRGKSYKYRIRNVRTISGTKFISDYSSIVTVKVKRKLHRKAGSNHGR